MMLLIAALVAIYARLRQPRRITSGEDIGGYSLGSLASRNATRHPLRSTMTIGLMSSAAFLIIAIAAFRLQPSDQGTGGFELIGQTAQPLYRDLRDPAVRTELLGRDRETVPAPYRSLRSVERAPREAYHDWRSRSGQGDDYPRVGDSPPLDNWKGTH